jgi:hypothetical protein
MALLLLLFVPIPTGETPLVKASPSNPITKPMEFYFHYVERPVTVAGLETKYVMNTTRWFKFLTQEEAHANSFYKPTGLPKIVIDFYLYPNFAGQASINGSWQVFIWVNSSAYTPVEFALEFREITLGGVTLWDSGLLSPVVTSTIGEYVDVPVYSYNLSVPLAHSFNADTTLQVEITINTGASADARIWYDSPLYPSKVILPVQDYARPLSVETYNANRTRTTVYSVFWNESQRKVIVQANVTDPFGGYDIYMVNATILNPGGQPVLSDVNMTRTTDSFWKTKYSLLYEVEWLYPSTAMSGNYTVMVTVIDYNGFYHYQNTGSFEPFIEGANVTFSIGVQYPVQVKTIDAHNKILPNATVKAMSGDVVLASGYTNSSGWWNIGLWAGHYNITVFWYGVEVAMEPVQVANQSSFVIQCRVYYPSFRVVDDVKSPLAEAEVYITSPNGTTTMPPLYTAQDGYINLTQAPGGIYRFVILWKGVTVKDEEVTVDSDGPYTLSTEVYQLTVRVLGKDGAPVSGAYVIVYTQSGVGYGLEITDSAGQAAFRLPKGTYKVDVRFSSVYWLTTTASQVSEPSKLIDSSDTMTVILEDFPPAIWTTLGFWIVIVCSIIPVVLAFLFIYKRGRIFTR